MNKSMLKLEIERMSDAEEQRAVTEAERNVLLDIEAGFKRKYKVFAWTLEGNLNIDLYKKAYNELFYKNSSLRAHYIMDGFDYPKRIVEKNKERIFKLMDLRSLSEAEQKTLLQNAIVALSREDYSPNVDLPIKLNAYIIDNNTIEVVLALYTYFGDLISADSVRRNVFLNLRMNGTTPMFVVDEDKSEQLTNHDNKKCFEYWKKETIPLGKCCVVPFSYKKKSDKYEDTFVIEREIAGDINAKLVQSAKDNGYDYKSMILFAFSKLLMEYNDTENPIVFIKKPLSTLTVMPLKIRSQLGNSKCFEDIFRQFEYNKNYIDCGFDAFCEEFDINKDEDLDLLFDFIDEDETSESKGLKWLNAGNSLRVIPRLEICSIYSRKENSLKIRYTYEIDGISEDTIGMIHDSFLKAINELIFEADKFDWKKYVSEYKDDREKLYKINVAQKALYIKSGEFLETKDPKDVLLVSEKSKVGTYMAEECVYSEGRVLEYIGILLEGHLEERYVGMDGITRTLSIYKKGYILGLEALTDEPRMKFSYVATESGVKVIWIPVSELERVMNRDSASYTNLLQKALKETVRVKKLWALG